MEKIKNVPNHQLGNAGYSLDVFHYVLTFHTNSIDFHRSHRRVYNSSGIPVLNSMGKWELHPQLIDTCTRLCYFSIKVYKSDNGAHFLAIHGAIHHLSHLSSCQTTAEKQSCLTATE